MPTFNLMSVTHELMLSLAISTLFYSATTNKKTEVGPRDLVLRLNSIVADLLNIQPQWEGDCRVVELVDAQRLFELTNRFCAGRDTGWDF